MITPGLDIGGDDISLGNAVNSAQEWQGLVTGGGLVAGARPELSDYLTQNQISRGVREQAGAPSIGAKPGTDIRSPFDKGESVGGGIGGGLTDESKWRGIFGPKESASDVGKARPWARPDNAPIGMHSVMAGVQHATNLLHSLAGGNQQLPGGMMY